MMQQYDRDDAEACRRMAMKGVANTEANLRRMAKHNSKQNKQRFTTLRQYEQARGDLSYIDRKPDSRGADLFNCLELTCQECNLNRAQLMRIIGPLSEIVRRKIANTNAKNLR